MGKFKLIIVVLFIGLSVKAQTYKPFTPTKGEIIFKEVSKITNRKLFDETLKTSKEKFKESLKKSLMKEDNSKQRGQEIEQMIEISSNMLETTAFIEDSTQMYKQRFENSKVINFVLENGEIINEYDGSALLSNNIVLKISEDKENKKIIQGYDCYKVIYEFKENNENADEDYKIYTGNTIFKREMWVTDKIKLLFHPVILEKSILEKYYPLDILETQKDIKGFERKFQLEKLILE